MRAQHINIIPNFVGRKYMTTKNLTMLEPSFDFKLLNLNS